VLVRFRALGHPRPGRRLLAPAVLSGQPAARKRAEGLVRDPAPGAQRQHVALVTTFQQGIGVLHERRAASVESGAQLFVVEVADTVGPGQPAFDELLERRDRLSERRLGIERVREVEVDTVDAQATETGLDLPEDAVAPETVILARVHRIERLRRERGTVPRRAHPPADRRLAAAASVRVGRVERPLLRFALAEQLGRRPDPAEVAAAEDDP